jgi:hypothetical protein
MCQANILKFPLKRTFPLILVLALLVVNPAIGGQPAAGKGTIPPPRGSIYVDVGTDSTGAVDRLVFLNKVAPEVQEWLRKETLGHHFGLPNHTYRRHIEYERIDGKYYSR